MEENVEVIGMLQKLGARILELEELQMQYAPGTKEWKELQVAIENTYEEFRKYDKDDSDKNSDIESGKSQKRRLIFDGIKVGLELALTVIGYSLSWKMMNKAYTVQDESIVNHPDAVNRSKTFYENTFRSRKFSR